MASYFEWNEAIAKFFAEGVPRGEALYLSVDEDTLVEIASYAFSEKGPPDPVLDFEMAVQEECVSDGRVTLPGTTLRQPTGTPACVAFLSAMVLAAYRMAPEDGISEINYFTRLREILGLTDGSGRPPGMFPPAPEEALWVSLNQWVVDNELQPSAERGPEGPTKFTNYPLSQSLLREGDKGKLGWEFRRAEGELGRDADRERIRGWFFNRFSGFSTSHIRSLAREATAERYDAIVDAVYGVYTGIDWVNPGSNGTRWSGPGWLTAGLYREFNPLSGQIAYHLYPRRQANGVRGRLEIMHAGSPELLHRSRDGHFRPLWPISPSGGETYPIIGDPRITELRIPKRSFWVLTRDPFDDASRIFASRGSPRLGETFLLLCRKECEDQLTILKDEGLLNWASDPVESPDHDGWAEYRECLVLSSGWDGIIPQMPELFDELRPRNRASISLQGGLSTGRRDTWLEGYLPRLFITSFDSTCRVSVTNISRLDVEPDMDDTVAANVAIEFPQLAVGDHLIEVMSADRSADRRHIRVLSWEALEPAEQTATLGTPVGDYILNGGLLTLGRDGGV